MVSVNKLDVMKMKKRSYMTVIATVIVNVGSGPTRDSPAREALLDICAPCVNECADCSRVVFFAIGQQRDQDCMRVLGFPPVQPVRVSLHEHPLGHCFDVVCLCSMAGDPCDKIPHHLITRKPRVEEVLALYTSIHVHILHIGSEFIVRDIWYEGDRYGIGKEAVDAQAIRDDSVSFVELNGNR